MLSRETLVSIVFDLAGVVVEYDQAALIADVFPDPATHAAVRAEIIGHADWLALDRGTISQEEAIDRAAHRTALSAVDIARFLQQMSAAWVTIPGTIDLLHRLHAKGQALFCLSNMHAASITYLEKTYAFWEVFSGVVISSRTQLIKPEPEIYTHLLDKYGLNAPETIFIDDTRANLEAAAQMNIKTIHFENPLHCERQLHALGRI